MAVTVANTGDRAGDAVLQVYVACDSPFAPLHPRLCGFRRVSLAAGESRRVVIPLDSLTATVVDEEGRRQPVEHMTFHVGLCQPDALSVRLTGQQPLTVSV